MPIIITLPDGSQKQFDGPVTCREVAESIGKRLAKDALGCKVDGVLSDLDACIEGDARVEIVTPRDRQGRLSDDALYLLRHSAAHVMAEAIQRIVPGAELVYGPPVDTGFYYDIRFPEDRPLREGDFEAIEREMAEIVKADRPFTRYEMQPEEGLKKLRAEGSKYKIDNAERALAASEPDPEDMGRSALRADGGRSALRADGGRSALRADGGRSALRADTGASGSPEGDGSESRPTRAPTLSFYATGEPGKDWEDLCRGPHVPSTGRIGGFKVMSLASSYWHGDEKSDRLTRVYGVAFPTQTELDEHLERLEQARERDHRVLGRQLGLFHIDEAVGQGLILWTPAGSVVRKELQNFISEELRKQGYSEVFTPHIGKLELYRTSGHFPYYADSQYPPVVERETIARLGEEGCTCAELSNMLREGEIDGYLLKPMNCPHHIKIYDSRPHSYRDLPVRLAEFGTVYRWEQSGEIGGMTRVRSFTQDDAHIFCTPGQVADELRGCLSLVRIIFDALNMTDYRVRVGLRDPDSSKYTGEPANWDKAEAACREAAKSLGVPFSEEPGEAAFYGPKIDFVVKDVIGREWQLGTVQVDYNLPERFGLSYIGADNAQHRPVMIHRAPFGSMERFVAVLIEHFAGAFPAWLAPEQARVLPVSEKSSGYAQRVLKMLTDERLRATADLSGDRLQAKIKVASDLKIPYLLVVGPRDEEAGTVSIRRFGTQKDLGAMPAEAFAQALAQEVRTRGAEGVQVG